MYRLAALQMNEQIKILKLFGSLSHHFLKKFLWKYSQWNLFLCRLQYVHSAMFPRVMDGVLHFGFSAHAVLNIIHGTVYFLKTRLYFPANHWPLPHDEWVSLLACLKALCCAIGTLWPGRWGCTLCKCKSRSCAFKNKIHQCNELFKGLIMVV